MRKKIVAGNWKMNLLWKDARALVEDLTRSEEQFPADVTVWIAPPAPYLSKLSEMMKNRIALAGQNCSEHASGAFTGEFSATILKSIDVNFCIVGHSERRTLFGDTDERVKAKTEACIKAGVSPIICCGEQLDDRKRGRHFEVVKHQISKVLAGMSAKEMNGLVLAYEPVWAIGTGETASADQAQEMHEFIRKLVAEHSDQDVANSVSILYGGSVKPSNASEIFACKDVDGGLIGGASLNAEDFISIIKAEG